MPCAKEISGHVRLAMMYNYHAAIYALAKQQVALCNEYDLLPHCSCLQRN